MSGYSMGGFGTYRMLARWPDLFARGFSVVGAPGAVEDQLVSLRNTPLLAWNASADELVNLQTSEEAVTSLTEAGVRFEEDLFAPADHLTLAANDEYGPGADFLRDDRVDRNPAHVSFVVDPTEDSAGVVSDHAYWLSSVAPRAKGNAVVDALSQSFGARISTLTPLTRGAGVLTGGAYALPFVSRSQTYLLGASAPGKDALRLTLTNVRSVSIDVRRAHLSCRAALAVKTDGPVRVTLLGCGKTLAFG